MSNDDIEASAMAAEFSNHMKRGYARDGLDFEAVRQLRLAQVESLEQILREAEHEKYSEGLVQYALGEQLWAQASLALMDGRLEAADELSNQSLAAYRRAVEARKADTDK